MKAREHSHLEIAKANRAEWLTSKRVEISMRLFDHFFFVIEIVQKIAHIV